MRAGATFSLFLLGACVLAPPSSVLADSVTHTEALGVLTTNWSRSVTMPRFDPALGTLMKIILEVNARVEGNAFFESLDGSAATVTMQLAATVRLQRPDTTDLLSATPTANTSDNVTAFDGVLDFGGNSGKSYNGLSASLATNTTLMSPFSAMDAATFIGTSDVTLPVRATGASGGSGAANLVLQFATSAEAEISVTYEFLPIPEPSSLTLLASALLVTVRPGRWANRRRR